MFSFYLKEPFKSCFFWTNSPFVGCFVNVAADEIYRVPVASSHLQPVFILQVMVDVDDKNDWKECIDIGGVRLPTGYFFGASAATGDLSGTSESGATKEHYLHLL